MKLFVPTHKTLKGQEVLVAGYTNGTYVPCIMPNGAVQRIRVDRLRSIKESDEPVENQEKAA